MKKKLFQNKIVVKKSPIHGYGVYAEEIIKKGSLVEECHVLLTRHEDEDYMDYYFKAGSKRNAIILGYGCIYNHSETPNAELIFEADYSGANVIARAAIKKGEEIFISYGKEWFDSRDMKSKEQESKRGASKQTTKPARSRKVKSKSK